MTPRQKRIWIIGIAGIILAVITFNFLLFTYFTAKNKVDPPLIEKSPASYWFLLHRKSQKEYFYRGIPGDPQKSTLIKTFTVKTGIPGERPTPLPKLLGREYWVIID